MISAPIMLNQILIPLSYCRSTSLVIYNYYRIVLNLKNIKYASIIITIRILILNTSIIMAERSAKKQ